MALWSWKDISAFTYNSQDLKAFVRSISGVKQSAVMDEWVPAGSAWPTNSDTGQRRQDPISVEFTYDGSATGPAVKCANGTSATLTYTFATGQSVSGTFVVSSFEPGFSPDGMNTLTVEFTPSGTITTDYAE